MLKRILTAMAALGVMGAFLIPSQANAAPTHAVVFTANQLIDWNSSCD